MPVVDLGCGNAKKGDIGIDIVGPPKTQADVVCHLGFEKIPLDDNSVDKIISHHFIEHVPFMVHDRRFIGFDAKTTEAVYEWKRHLPQVQLHNEMWRILKDGGTFECTVPVYPHLQIFQDPTHVAFYTTETVRYFSGDYYGFHEIYGHTSRFELSSLRLISFWMEYVLTAIKDLPDDAPYVLDYGRSS